MKQWYYTDSLWHKVFGPNDKHPEEKEMYRFKKWTVNKWTFATSSKVSLRPGTSKVGEASGREGGGKLPDRGTCVAVHAYFHGAPLFGDASA